MAAVVVEDAGKGRRSGRDWSATWRRGKGCDTQSEGQPLTCDLLKVGERGGAKGSRMGLIEE